jgi:hypothetical protein
MASYFWNHLPCMDENWKDKDFRDGGYYDTNSAYPTECDAHLVHVAAGDDEIVSQRNFVSLSLYAMSDDMLFFDRNPGLGDTLEYLETYFYGRTWKDHLPNLKHCIVWKAFEDENIIESEDLQYLPLSLEELWIFCYDGSDFGYLPNLKVVHIQEADENKIVSMYNQGIHTIYTGEYLGEINAIQQLEGLSLFEDDVLVVGKANKTLASIS